MRRNALARRLLAAAFALAITASAALAAGMDNFTQQTEYTPFPDVAADAWYAQDVQKAVELGFMNGKDDGTFDPLGNLTLAEAVTMAAKVCSTYDGGGFTPGGDPWYQNAVDYGEEMGFLMQEEYDDYTQLATRADVAGIFAFILPDSEYTRINRISNIPDVTADTLHVDYIYQLYNAGILTGDSTGAFHPDDNISRAEAAAILNRVALVDSRKAFSLTTPAAGTLVSNTDGSARVVIPEGWTGEYDAESGAISCASTGISVSVMDLGSKSGYGDSDVVSMGQAFEETMLAKGAVADYEPRLTSLRGLLSYACSFTSGSGEAQVYTVCYCVENTSNYYYVVLEYDMACDEQSFEEGWDIIYSLDLAL